MNIHRILNNNAVIVLDEEGQEQIVCGKGIAFKKKSGEKVSEDVELQVFTLKDNEMNQKFQQLFGSIPIEEITLAEEIIEMAKSYLGKRLNESIFVSLTDHIHTSLVRHDEGFSLTNAMLWDVKRFYKDEFDAGIIALDMIEKEFGVRLPDDEAAFIAIHLVNAELDEDIHNMMEITKMMQEMSSIVKYVFNLEFDEDDVYYYRFVTHLKFFAQRVINGKTYEDNEDDLLEMIKERYRNAYKCVLKIAEFLEKTYSYTVSNEEIAYLTIHVQRVVYKTRK